MGWGECDDGREQDNEGEAKMGEGEEVAVVAVQ